MPPTAAQRLENRIRNLSTSKRAVVNALVFDMEWSKQKAFNFVVATPDSGIVQKFRETFHTLRDLGKRSRLIRKWLTMRTGKRFDSISNEETLLAYDWDVYYLVNHNVSLQACDAVASDMGQTDVPIKRAYAAAVTTLKSRNGSCPAYDLFERLRRLGIDPGVVPNLETHRPYVIPSKNKPKKKGKAKKKAKGVKRRKGTTVGEDGELGEDLGAEDTDEADSDDEDDDDDEDEEGEKDEKEEKEEEKDVCGRVRDARMRCAMVLKKDETGREVWWTKRVYDAEVAVAKMMCMRLLSPPQTPASDATVDA